MTTDFCDHRCGQCYLIAELTQQINGLEQRVKSLEENK